MRLVYYHLNAQFEINERALNFIILENPVELEKFILSLFDKIERKDSMVELMEEMEILDFRKNVEFITSPMDLIYEKKDLQKKLLFNLSEEIQNSELVQDFIEVQGKIYDIIEKLKELDYELDVEQNYSVDVLLKSFDVHLRNPEGDFVQKFIEYSTNIHRILGKEVFILLSCSQYIRKSNFKYLLEHAEYEGIKIIFIENHQLYLNLKTKEYIIDNDLCELY